MQEKNLKIDFPTANAYGLEVRHLKWELRISTMCGDPEESDKDHIVVFVYPNEQDEYYGYIVDEEFEQETTFKHILDVIEHRIFEMIGQNLEVPVRLWDRESSIVRRI